MAKFSWTRPSLNFSQTMAVPSSYPAAGPTEFENPGWNNPGYHFNSVQGPDYNFANFSNNESMNQNAQEFAKTDSEYQSYGGGYNHFDPSYNSKFLGWTHQFKSGLSLSLGILH